MMDEYDGDSAGASRKKVVFGCLGVLLSCLLMASFALNVYLGWNLFSKEEPQFEAYDDLPLEKSIIEFGSGDYYSIQVEDGKVVGGYGQGSTYWDVVGGAYDGRNLQVVFVTTERSGCNQWWSHNFLVEPSQVVLRSSVNKCGEALVDRDVVYQRHQ